MTLAKSLIQSTSFWFLVRDAEVSVVDPSANDLKNQKPETRNQKLETRNQKPET